MGSETVIPSRPVAPVLNWTCSRTHPEHDRYVQASWEGSTWSPIRSPRTPYVDRQLGCLEEPNEWNLQYTAPDWRTKLYNQMFHMWRHLADSCHHSLVLFIATDSVLHPFGSLSKSDKGGAKEDSLLTDNPASKSAQSDPCRQGMNAMASQHMVPEHRESRI